MAAYQGPSNADGDPNNEFYVAGLTGGGASPTRGRGSVVFLESLRDLANADGWTPAQLSLVAARVLVHEIGHQFGILDGSLAIPRIVGDLYDYRSLFDPSDSPRFTDAQQASLRAVASPGT